MIKQNIQIVSNGPNEMKRATSHRIFLLSPAYAGGERARMILRDQAQFPLARKLRGKSGAPIADVFTFLSGLYFRGKIAYANAFARPARGTSGVLVITPTRGLIDARTRIRLDDLREFAEVDIHEADPRYRMPIERDARHLATKLLGPKRSGSPRQHRHRQICRRVAGKLWPATAISGGLCRPRRHESRRIDVALRRGSSGTFIPASGGRDCERETAAETRAEEIRDCGACLFAQRSAKGAFSY